MGCWGFCRLRTCLCCSVRVGTHIIGWIILLLGLGGAPPSVFFLVRGIDKRNVVLIAALAPTVAIDFFILVTGFCVLLGAWTARPVVLTQAYCLILSIFLTLLAIAVIYGTIISFSENPSKCMLPLFPILLLLFLLFWCLVVINSYKKLRQEESESDFDYEDPYQDHPCTHGPIGAAIT